MHEESETWSICDIGESPDVLHSQSISLVLFGFFHSLLILTDQNGSLDWWSHDLSGCLQEG